MMKKNRSEKIRVLIVDDSLLFQELLTIGLGTDRTIEVVARAVDPFEARDKLIEYRPDVMLCDVNMPKMNGIEFIRRLLPVDVFYLFIGKGVSTGCPPDS